MEWRYNCAISVENRGLIGNSTIDKIVSYSQCEGFNLQMGNLSPTEKDLYLICVLRQDCNEFYDAGIAIDGTEYELR